ncbi:MAG TPA: FHA domain-containing protein [Blastocatellia bacterium]|nr:FHA domain-containing protein [Blastocatellia bacterium]
MAEARLTISSAGGAEREFELKGEASIGRAPDNLIRINDALVSQYHAVIEKRDDSFYLIDLGSTNGTTVNGDPVAEERKLSRGDMISIGGVATVAFQPDEYSSQADTRIHPESDSAQAAADTDSDLESARTNAPPRTSLWMIVAAVVAGIVLAGGAVMIAAGVFSGSEGTVRVLSPETGATIRGPQRVRVEAEEISEIEEVIYLIDGVRVASSDYPPFEVTLDPADLRRKVRNLDSGNHVLTVNVQDKDGNNIPQPETILIAFDSGPEPVETIDGKIQDGETGRETSPPVAQSGAADVAALARNLAATISGKSFYDFDAQFTDEIRRRTDAYRVNVIDDASRYRRQIGSAFNSKGLPAAVGFVMALSESRFKEDAMNSLGAEQKIGLWLVPRQIALEQGYITADETAAALKDVKRSAEVAASYINDLVNALGGTDQFMYAIACYGMPLAEAARVRARLEEIDPEATDRRNFWRMVKAGVVPRDAAERVAKFFAAGIVGENPQAFGLGSRPLSSLY